MPSTRGTDAVDDREPAAVVERVRAHPDVGAVDVRRLTAGDLVVGSVGVERKTLADYASALLARAGPDLYDQVERLHAAYDHSYLLLEDQFPADGDDRVPAVAIRGSAASITAHLETPVVPCSDLDRLVDVAVRLGRKHGEDPSTPALPAGAVTGRSEPTAKRMYGCVDGIGPETAERLYAAFSTVADLVAAPPGALEAVEGVGPERAAAIRAAVGIEERPPAEEP